MSKFYAVKEGRKPGVYTTWADCEAQVKGYPGADYKKFNNEEDARLFVYGVCETITTMNQMEFKGYEPEVQYIKLNTLEEVKLGLERILKGTQDKDTFEILKNVQDIAMLLNINIEGLSNIVDFM